MARDDDTALVRAAREGRREAFTALVRKHQNYAYGTAVGLLSDFELARDVVQEAFLVAYQDLGKLRQPERFGLWLRGIVRHTALKARRERDRVRALADELRHSLDLEAPAPDHTDLDGLRRRMVRLALEGLGDSHREVIGLYYTGAMSYAAIAAFLGITPTAVQGRLQRAREQLKKELKMVEERFEEEGLPEDFAAEVARLLDSVAAKEEEQAIARLQALGADAVDPLCQIIEDPRDPRARLAALALVAIGDERAVLPLLRVLYNGRAWFFARRNADDRGWPPDWSSIAALLELPGLRDKMLERVRSRQASWSEVMTLGYAVGDDEAYESLAPLYRQTRDPHLRATALQSLCQIRPDGAPALLAEALAGEQAYRDAACPAAFYAGVTPTLDSCIGALVAGVSDRYLGFLLGHIHGHGEQGAAALRQLLAADSAQVRFNAALALAPTRDEAAFAVMLQNFLDAAPDRGWDFKHWRPLGTYYAPQLTAWIEANPEVAEGKPALLAALAHRPELDAEAGPAFDSLAREGGWAVQGLAVKILAKSRGEAALPELRRQLAEGKRAPARAAFWAVYQMGAAAHSMVEDMWHSENWKERKAAVCLQRRWGLLTDERKAQAKADEHVAVRRASEPYIKRRLSA